MDLPIRLFVLLVGLGITFYAVQGKDSNKLLALVFYRYESIDVNLPSNFSSVLRYS